MEQRSIDAVIIGHLCLDITPTFPAGAGRLHELLVPGRLVDVGGAVLSPGGAASNTGLALHRLGFAVGIAGKVGDDVFGGAVIKLLREGGGRAAEDMIVSPGEGTSYSIVISPPGVDRIFLHSSGANDTFRAADVPDAALERAGLVHFGYPPLMRNFYLEDGAELTALFSRARRKGLTTSLDMARPDPDGPSGGVDWKRYLENVLPHVDVFLPSVDEILFMTDRPLFDELLRRADNGNPATHLDVETLRRLADRMLNLGAAVVGFKLGDQGFYLKTTKDAARLRNAGRAAPKDVESWRDAELLAPCRTVRVAGTAGAGDCTIAGFLGALLRGLSPDEAAAMAVGVGAASVEAMDANSGVPRWEAVAERLAAGWPVSPCRPAPGHWPTTPAGNRSPK